METALKTMGYKTQIQPLNHFHEDYGLSAGTDGEDNDEDEDDEDDEDEDYDSEDMSEEEDALMEGAEGESDFDEGLEG